QIATEVTNAALQVTATQERYQAATVARELAEKRLEAEQSKFEVGMSTNFFVVQAQRDLADAQNVELRALLDFRKAQVHFDRSEPLPAWPSIWASSAGSPQKQPVILRGALRVASALGRVRR